MGIQANKMVFHAPSVAGLWEESDNISLVIDMCIKMKRLSAAQWPPTADKGKMITSYPLPSSSLPL
jgi:hypothetical protein